MGAWANHSFSDYGASGTHIPPAGSPRVDSSQLLDTLKKRAGIDWNSIMNQHAIPADVTIPPGSWPSRNWEGIILVGGIFISADADTVLGAVISGLNRSLPNAVNPPNNTLEDNDILYTRPFISYNSCKAGRAAERLKVYFAWSNTWLDNVAVW